MGKIPGYTALTRKSKLDYVAICLESNVDWFFTFTLLQVASLRQLPHQKSNTHYLAIPQ